MNLPAWLENAYELLDSEGEWYLDRGAGVLYYKPRAGEDLAAAQVVAPRLETLVLAGGSADAPVEHLRFEGLTFTYAGWLGPSTSDGYVGLQTGYHFTGSPEHLVAMPAHLDFRAAREVRFERDVFEHLGADALHFGQGSQGDSVVGCRFEDVSGAAIHLGDVEEPEPADPRRRNREITVQNNYIARIGVEYFDAPGIFAAYLERLVVDHNELYDLPYSGIALGWGWGKPSYARDNTVSQNYIHDFTKVLRDSAAIYTLGAQPGTAIRGNSVWQGWNAFGCLYPDEGSAGMTWTGNVCRHVPEWLHLWTRSIHDNIVEGNYADTPHGRNDGERNKVRNNALISDGNWPTEALNVMRSAGIQAAYRDVRR
jgi:hypothetical protein